MYLILIYENYVTVAKIVYKLTEIKFKPKQFV